MHSFLRDITELIWNKLLELERNYGIMSTMKDYMMWLNHNGVIDWRPTIGVLRIPTGINIYDEELVERWKNDTNWHCPDDDDDMIEDDEEDEFPEDDNDLGDMCEWSPEEHWIAPDGGMTADAVLYLHELDSEGELI